MTSQTKYYLPFWVLYDVIGDTPQEPFVLVHVIKRQNKEFGTPEGPKTIDCVDVALYDPQSGLNAEDVPFEMLIHPDAIQQWADKIAGWFTDHAKILSMTED